MPEFANGGVVKAEPGKVFVVPLLEAGYPPYVIPTRVADNHAALLATINAASAKLKDLAENA